MINLTIKQSLQDNSILNLNDDILLAKAKDMFLSYSKLPGINRNGMPIYNDQEMIQYGIEQTELFNKSTLHPLEFKQALLYHHFS